MRLHLHPELILVALALIACTDSSPSQASDGAPTRPASVVGQDEAPDEEPQRPSELDAARNRPLPEVDARRIAFGSARYRTTFTLDGKERSVLTRRLVERATEDGESVVRIRQVNEDTEGSGEDVFDLAADSLRPLRRRFVQATNSAEIDYREDHVRGVIRVAENEIAVQIELEAPAFGDGSALETAILAMPLAEGYRALLRSVDAGIQQRVRFWSLHVARSETIEAPAGRFSTFRVELTALDDVGGEKTLWITDESPRRLIQTENRLPAELGGTVTTTALLDAS